MRSIFLIISSFFIFTHAYSPVYAATAPIRYMTCDACGLCPKIINGSNPTCTVTSVPGDWEQCARCLYPTIFPAGQSADPKKCETLVINDATNLAKIPVTKGRQFTMFGCLSAGTNVGFTDQKGAPSFVQAMLNVVFSLSGGIAFLYLLYGGKVILTSQADPESLNYGKRLIYGSIVGLIFTLGSVFLVNIIGAGILRIPGFSGP